MEFDALDKGVKRGGLVNRAEIRILICHILSKTDAPLKKENLCEILHFDGIANFFEVGAAVNDLILQKMISQDNGFLKNTSSGKSTSEALSNTLPLTIREQAIDTVNRSIKRSKYKAETKVDIQQSSNGYIVSCTILEGKDEMLTVRLLVPDEETADSVKQKFWDSPEALYSKILTVLG